MLHRCAGGKKIKLKLLEFIPKTIYLPAEWAGCIRWLRPFTKNSDSSFN